MNTARLQTLLADLESHMRRHRALCPTNFDDMGFDNEMSLTSVYGFPYLLLKFMVEVEKQWNPNLFDLLREPPILREYESNLRYVLQTRYPRWLHKQAPPTSKKDGKDQPSAVVAVVDDDRGKTVQAFVTLLKELFKQVCVDYIGVALRMEKPAKTFYYEKLYQLRNYARSSTVHSTVSVLRTMCSTSRRRRRILRP